MYNCSCDKCYTETRGALWESGKSQKTSWRKCPSAEMLSVRCSLDKEGLEEPSREKKKHVQSPWGRKEQGHVEKGEEGAVSE